MATSNFGRQKKVSLVHKIDFEEIMKIEQKKKLLLKQKRAIANTFLLNLKVLSTLASSIIKLTISSSTSLILSIFILIEKISNSNYKSQYIDKSQK